MKTQKITKVLSTILALALCLTPELMSAAQQNAQQATVAELSSSQGDSTSQQSAIQEPQQQEQQQPAPQNRGNRVDPSQPPLQPITTYPDAPTPQQDQNQPTSEPATTTTTTTTTTAPAPQTQKPVTEPVGAAAAEKVETAGGAASKPAGAAIAPAKQHQTRSLLIKIGAFAAGGLAAGTVYALTRSTPSKPPGAGTSGTTQK